MDRHRQVDSMHLRILYRVFGRYPIPTRQPSGGPQKVGRAVECRATPWPTVTKPLDAKLVTGTYVRRGVTNTLTSVWYVG